MEMWSAYCPDLLEELLVVTPIKAIEHAVSQNGYDSSKLQTRLAATAVKFTWQSIDPYKENNISVEEIHNRKQCQIKGIEFIAFQIGISLYSSMPDNCSYEAYKIKK